MNFIFQKLQSKPHQHHSVQNIAVPFFPKKVSMNTLDVSEKDAEASAEKVNEAPADKVIQRKNTDAGITNPIALSLPGQGIVENTTSSTGLALDQQTRQFMETRFNYDFSNVRVHTGTVAEESAATLNARAYTTGSQIIFNRGMYDPNGKEGRKLLAHELTHVIQQKGSAEGNLIQRSPLDIHGPVLDQFSAETGTPRSEASPHSRMYDEWIHHSASQYRADVLNTRPHTDAEYVRFITNADDNLPLWPLLTTRQSRINFIRFLIARDTTNCRPYHLPQPISTGCIGVERNQEVFTNLCMGFATQFYARYNNATARLSGAEITSLENVGHVYAGQMLPKFRVPVFMAMYPGHAFNAFLIDSNASDISSYLFLEPQDDSLFTSADPSFSRYFEQGMITINTLTGFTVDGQYQTSHEHTFAAQGGVPVHAVIDEGARMALANLSRALAIANDPSAWLYTIENPRLTFDSYFLETARGHSDTQLAAIFPYLNGRSFRRSPTSTSEILTKPSYIQLTGRTALQTLIP